MAKKITSKNFYFGDSQYAVSNEKVCTLNSIINTVYHSESWQDMWMKIDLNQLVVDTDVFMMLCNTLCYHYGFWPHTRPRYYAFKKFLNLRKDNPLSKVKMLKKTYNAVFNEVEAMNIALKTDLGKRIPGYYSERRAWKSILHILHKFQFGNIKKR